MKFVCLSVVLFLSLISVYFPDMMEGLEGQQMVRLCICTLVSFLVC